MIVNVNYVVVVLLLLLLLLSLLLLVVVVVRCNDGALPRRIRPLGAGGRGRSTVSGIPAVRGEGHDGRMV